MKPLLVAVAIALVSSATAADWRVALPGWQYQFPRDHHSHPGFQTEWWYLTGNLNDTDGRRFGYQLTLFRQGVRLPEARGSETSRFIVDDVKFAHFAISDPGDKRFHFTQKLSRGAFGEAGFSAGDRLAWIDDWSIELPDERTMRLRASADFAKLDLTVKKAKPWAIHGTNGVSQKAEGKGRASHYYSGTRMSTTGQLTLGGAALMVSGDSWFDHEWATNQLTAEQVGWNWFSIQLDNGSELMLYQMRRRAGGFDPVSSGTFITRDGQTQHLARDDYQLTPRRLWTSKQTGGRYPLSWDLRVPKIGLTLQIDAPLDAQELVLKPIAYWEGMIDVQGTRGEQPVRGHGYMELTGYAGELVGLSAK